MASSGNGGGAWPTGLIEVAPGAYAYVQAGGKAGISNAGVLIGPDGVVVLDTLATTPMALGFLGAIRAVTGAEIDKVLITHHHVDHILGIQYFLPAPVICHRRCREEIVAQGADLPQNWARRRPQFADDVADIRVCLPDQTFEDRVTLHLGGSEVVFYHPGIAHTVGDALLHLPQQKVLFAGDIFFHQVVPAGFEGHIGKWLALCDVILDMDVETIVPGHGPVGGKDEFAEMRDCLTRIYESSRRSFEDGLTSEAAIARVDLGPYAGWGDADERMPQDVNRAYAEFRGELDDL